MNLRLKYDPTAANAPYFAADISRSAAEISGANLDYSVASLEVVDRIVEDFRNDGLTTEQVGETLFGFGCYVGEVLARNAAATWVDADDQGVAIFGFPIFVRLPWGTECNPIGKVFKRLQNGDVDNLPYFYEVFGVERAPTDDA